MSKIEHGQFFTERNIFQNNPIFKKFIKDNNLINDPILEPFAGANNLIHFLQLDNPHLQFSSYDLEPKNEAVIKNDSINNWNYDKNFKLVITNPPYLSKNSAHRMKINADFQNYDDLYKLSLDRCIENVRFTVAIIPTTLICSNRKEDLKLLRKLVIFQLLPDKDNFNDTEHPSALAYFDNMKNDNLINFELYENNNFIENYDVLIKKEASILKQQNTKRLKFNSPYGNICISASDNTKDKNNIRFLNADWIKPEEVKNTDRHKVKILIDGLKTTNKIIEEFNNKIKDLRDNHCDYLWASFKGVSKTGHFRKRIDFKTIKKIINSIKL